MKFSSLSAFEKHLHESSPSSSYLIITPDDEERKKIVSQVASFLQKKFRDIEMICLSQCADSFSKLCSHYSSLPLFSSRVALRIDDIAVYAKKEKEQICSLIQAPTQHAFLVLGASSGKEFSPLCSQAKEELVCLDLSQEKPWDKARRSKTSMQRKFFDAGKRISSSLIDHIFDACGGDTALIEQEIAKLLCYLAAKDQVELADVKAVCVQYSEPTAWQMVDQLLFEEKAPLLNPDFSLSELLPLFGLVRYQLTTARQVSCLLEQGMGLHEVAASMPQLKTATLDKLAQYTKRLSPLFFDEALARLFQIEFLSKNSSLSARLLWDYLTAHIHQLRRSYDKQR